MNQSGDTTTDQSGDTTTDQSGDTCDPMSMIEKLIASLSPDKQNELAKKLLSNKLIETQKTPPHSPTMISGEKRKLQSPETPHHGRSRKKEIGSREVLITLNTLSLTIKLPILLESDSDIDNETTKIIQESKWLAKGKYPALMISDDDEANFDKEIAMAIEMSKSESHNVSLFKTSEPGIFASSSKACSHINFETENPVIRYYLI